MPGLVPGIHVLSFRWAKTWMAGSSPAMTVDSGSLSLLAMPERDQLPQSADRDAAGKCAGLKLYMPAPPPAFRSKSSFIGGGNGAVGERKSVDPGDCTSFDPPPWFFVLVFSTPTLRFAPALAGGIAGAASSAVVHSVSVKSRVPKLRTHLSQNDCILGDTLSGAKCYPGTGVLAGYQAGVMRMDRVEGGLQVGRLSSIYALSFVMAGLDPAIHVFTQRKVGRGCPAHRRAKRRRSSNGYGRA